MKKSSYMSLRVRRRRTWQSPVFKCLLEIASLALAMTIVFSSCGSDNTLSGEDYGNISAGASGTIITESEHPSGWGESDCFECHSMENVHQTDRSGTGLNLEAIRILTEEQGLASCSACHGTNGVP